MGGVSSVHKQPSIMMNTNEVLALEELIDTAPASEARETVAIWLKNKYCPDCKNSRDPVCACDIPF